MHQPQRTQKKRPAARRAVFVAMAAELLRRGRGRCRLCGRRWSAPGGSPARASRPGPLPCGAPGAAWSAGAAGAVASGAGAVVVAGGLRPAARSFPLHPARRYRRRRRKDDDHGADQQAVAARAACVAAVVDIGIAAAEVGRQRFRRRAGSELAGGTGLNGSCPAAGSGSYLRAGSAMSFLHRWQRLACGDG